MLLTDDVCDCGLCLVDRCDFCPRPVAYLDAEGTAFCGDDHEPSRAWLDAESVWDGYPEFERGLAARRFK